MTPKTLILLAVGAAAIIAPAAASAQGYYDQFGQRSYDQRIDAQYRQPSYGQPRGDYGQDRRSGYGAYPQFRGMEQHIRAEIMLGLREDLIERDDARDLLSQLRDIQTQEWREYRVHGWNLPYDDQARIQARLNQLDRLVDEIRDQQ
jgi:hypothetical protein